MRLVAAALLAALLCPTAAALAPQLPRLAADGGHDHAAGGVLELEIVSSFLAPYDALPGLAHCDRFGGAGRTRDMPAAPHDHYNGTNRFLDEHLAWHNREGYAFFGRAAQDPENKYGDAFVARHRAMISAYDAWRVANGHAPVATWDPAGPIPPEFAYEPPPPALKAAVEPCVKRPATEQPDPTPRPSWLNVTGGDERDPVFGYTALCEFPDLNTLAKAIDPGATNGFAVGAAREVGEHAGLAPPPMHVHGYHGAGHGAGGDMSRAQVSPRDPLFWAWHKHLDSIFREWEAACAAAAEPATVAVAPPAAAREAPLPTALALAVVALAGAGRRR